MSPVPLLCLLEWQEGTHLPGTRGALWTCVFSAHFRGFPGENPTVSHGTPPVSLPSAWQEVLSGRVGQSENDHQAGPVEQNPLSITTTVQPPASLCYQAGAPTTAFIFNTFRHGKTRRSSEWGSQSPSHLSPA